MSILHSRDDDLMVIAGVVCSTWVAINQGTSGRDFLCPMGRERYASVAASNQMVSRSLAMICYRALSSFCLAIKFLSFGHFPAAEEHSLTSPCPNGRRGMVAGATDIQHHEWS